MKKVNFGIELKALGSKEKDKLNEIFARVLQMSTEGNPIKMNAWAKDMYFNGTIEIDDADLDALIKFVENNKNMPNITKALALEVMQKAKTEVK